MDPAVQQPVSRWRGRGPLRPSGALPLLSQEETDTLYQSLVSTRYSLSTYEENMRAFGAADARTVISLNICADTFARRQEVLRWLESYGEAVTVSETGGSVWETGTSWWLCLQTERGFYAWQHWRPLWL